MYQKYGVVKGAGDTWAPYATPAKIPVVKTAAVATDVANDAELGALAAPGVRGLRLRLSLAPGLCAAAGTSVAGSRQLSPLAEARSRRARGPAWGSWAARAWARWAIGHGRGGGGLANGPAVPLPELDRVSAEREAAGAAEAAKEEKSGDKQPSASQPDVADVLRQADDEAPAQRAVVTTAELASARVGDGQRLRRGRGRGAPRRASGRAGAAARVRPMRFTTPSDGAFDDVTAFVPALFADGFDTWRTALAAGARGKAPYAIDDAARALLERARRAVPAGVYRWGIASSRWTRRGASAGAARRARTSPRRRRSTGAR